MVSRASTSRDESHAPFSGKAGWPVWKEEAHNISMESRDNMGKHRNNHIAFFCSRNHLEIDPVVFRMFSTFPWEYSMHFTDFRIMGIIPSVCTSCRISVVHPPIIAGPSRGLLFGLCDPLRWPCEDLLEFSDKTENWRASFKERQAREQKASKRMFLSRTLC